MWTAFFRSRFPAVVFWAGGRKTNYQRTTSKKRRPHCGRQNGPAKTRGTKKRPPKWSRKYVLRRNVEPKSGRQNGPAFGRGTKKRPLFFQIFHLCSISGGPGFDFREPKRGPANTLNKKHGALAPHCLSQLSTRPTFKHPFFDISPHPWKTFDA